MVLGALLEITKLVMVAYLAANWTWASGLMRLVMVVLVVGLITVNGAGVFARPIESHLAVTVAASTSVGERIGILDARIAEQSRRVAGIEAQDREVANAVARMTSTDEFRHLNVRSAAEAGDCGSDRRAPSFTCDSHHAVS